jgi:hypothetical protein
VNEETSAEVKSHGSEANSGTFTKFAREAAVLDQRVALI